MSTLDALLREYTEHLDRAVRPVTVGEIFERPGNTTTSTQFRPPLAFAAAAAITIVAIGSLVLLKPSGVPMADEPVATTIPAAVEPDVTDPDVATTTQDARSSTTTQDARSGGATKSQPTIVWSRMDLVDSGDSTMADVVVVGERMVAVGSSGTLAESDAAVWYSEDGISWTQVSDGDLGGQGAQHMNAVTAGGPGFVAVGYDWTADSDPEGHLDAAAVWTSVDGIAWDRVPAEPGVLDADGFPAMNDVIKTGFGLIAVGRRSSGVQPDIAGVWTSTDGTVWEPVKPDSDVFARASINAVAVLGSRLVAVGGEGSTGERTGQSAVVWTSLDGVHWERVNTSDGVFGSLHTGEAGIDGDWAVMTSIAVGGPGLVAVGQDGWCTELGSCAGVSAVWTSTEGTTWIRRPEVDRVGFDIMHSVLAIGDDLVAAGSSSRPPAAGRAVVWTSTDGGTTWTKQAQDQEVFGGAGTSLTAMFALARTDHTLVAVGGSSSRRPDLPWTSTVWVGDLEPQP